MGFAATCSLVVIGKSGLGMSIEPPCESSTSTQSNQTDKKWDVVMWMDHRYVRSILKFLVTPYAHHLPPNLQVIFHKHYSGISAAVCEKLALFTHNQNITYNRGKK